MLHDAPTPLQLGQVAPAPLEAGHPQVVGDGYEQRALVEVSRLGAGLDLEDRPSRRGRVDRVTVVDDTLEHGQGADAHPSVLAHMDTDNTDALYVAIADELAAAVEAALPAWVERGVATILDAWQGGPGPADLEAAREAGRQAVADVGPRLRALLAADIDEQRATPLTLLRGAVHYPTEVLRRAGVPPVERDAFAEEAFPSDHYGLTPATFADIDPSLVEPALRWGAAKAFLHKRRHQR